MACHRVPFGDGVAILCGPRRRRVRCTHCREWADWLCDARGCDVPICARCRIHVPPDQDFCRAHRALAATAAAALRLPFD